MDYLLLEFRHTASLVTDDFAFVSHLPFHEHFKAAEDAIIEAAGGPSPLVQTHMTKLFKEISRSPALTETDRDLLQKTYVAARRSKEAAQKQAFAAGEPDLTGTVLDRLADEAQSYAVAEHLRAASRGLSAAADLKRLEKDERISAERLAKIAKVIRNAMPEPDLPIELFDLPADEQEELIARADAAREAASLGFLRAALAN